MITMTAEEIQECADHKRPWPNDDSYDLVVPPKCDGSHKHHAWIALDETGGKSDGGYPGRFHAGSRTVQYLHCKHCGARRMEVRDWNNPSYVRYDRIRLEVRS